MTCREEVLLLLAEVGNYRRGGERWRIDKIWREGYVLFHTLLVCTVPSFTRPPKDRALGLVLVLWILSNFYVVNLQARPCKMHSGPIEYVTITSPSPNIYKLIPGIDERYVIGRGNIGAPNVRLRSQKCRSHGLALGLEIWKRECFSRFVWNNDTN